MAIFKIFHLGFAKCHGRVRELLSFVEKSGKVFLQFDLQKKKKIVKHTENLSGKLIGNNSSISNIAVRN